MKWHKVKAITLSCPGQEAGVLHFSETSCIKDFSHHCNYQDEDGVVEKNHAKPARKSGVVVKILQMTGRLLIPNHETTLQHKSLFPLLHILRLCTCFYPFLCPLFSEKIFFQSIVSSLQFRCLLPRSTSSVLLPFHLK